METTFYLDEERNTNNVQKMKSKMTLDFNNVKSKDQKFTSLLASPDLNMLKLASPELEKMIMKHNGMVTTTPTPTQYVYPKFVTEEQEAYARGFVDALEELHKSGTVDEDSMDTSTYDSVISNDLKTITTLPGSVIPVTAEFTSTKPRTLTQLVSQPSNRLVNTRVAQLKEEPQTVPCMGGTPPLSPINMEKQETIKLERKRARNRVAARKCRTRKLERISRLEDKCDGVRSQNAELTATATALRDEVCRLKQQIMDHVSSGCQVMLAQNFTLS